MSSAKFRNTYSELQFLFDDLSSHLSKIQGFTQEELGDYRSQLFQYKLAFTSKFASLEIMHHYTLDRCKVLPKTLENEKKIRIVLTETTLNINEVEAFFEAYLNAFYSLLQVLAKFTPFFYKKEFPNIQIIDENFGKQIEFFRINKDVPDEKFSKYVENELYPWYKTLKEYRHAITHRAAIFVGFEQDDSIVFLKPPEEDETNFWFKKNKPSVRMVNYVKETFQNLFKFLEFYVNHFRPKIEMSKRTKLIKKALDSQASKPVG